jgi:hypothetical protein
MFKILSHKGNANQNYTEIPSHPSENSNHQENKNMVRMQRKKEPLYNTGDNVN